MANPEHLKILWQGVDWNEWRKQHPDVKPDLGGANLSRANLSGVNLSGVDLSGADLSGANLMKVNLSFANLAAANLREAYLFLVELYRGNLDGADLSRARAGGTSFTAVDLSTVTGLETIRHRRPSTIGIDTIYKSRGKIPAVFLVAAVCRTGRSNSSNSTSRIWPQPT